MCREFIYSEAGLIKGDEYPCLSGGWEGEWASQQPVGASSSQRSEKIEAPKLELSVPSTHPQGCGGKGQCVMSNFELMQAGKECKKFHSHAKHVMWEGRAQGSPE